MPALENSLARWAFPQFRNKYMLQNDFLVHLIDQYGLLVMFCLATFEGPIVAAIGGYLIRLGHFNWGEIALILIIADLVGDSILYWIGSKGRTEALSKWRKRAGLSDERLAKLQIQFHERGGLLILFGKIVHAPGLAILLAAGISHMNYWKFILFNLLGAVPKSIIFMGLGYMLGTAFGKLEGYLFNYTLVFIGLLIAAYLFYRQFLRKKEKPL